MQETLIIMMALICYEFGEDVPDDIRQLITTEKLLDLFRLSKRHDLAHLVGDALNKNGLMPENSEIKKLFLQEQSSAIFRYEQQCYEFERICKVLNDAGVPFIPLKGLVIRQYYPEPWMRTSCDIDILIKEENISVVTESLQTKLNYYFKCKGNHDISFYTETGVILELHYKLNSDKEPWDKVLKTVWGSSCGDVGSCRLLTSEMLYFYHIAHMAGHFKIGGCGVRPCLDLLLLRKNIVYDQKVLAELLEQGGLTAFNNAACALTDYWFADGKETPLILELNNFILYSGMYGDMKNRVAIAKVEKGSKLKVLVARIFPSYNQMIFKYPRLQKAPILYPFYIIKRWFALFKKDKREKSVEEFKETMKGNSKRQEKTEKLLKDLEL